MRSSSIECRRFALWVDSRDIPALTTTTTSKVTAFEHINMCVVSWRQKEAFDIDGPSHHTRKEKRKKPHSRVEEEVFRTLRPFFVSLSVWRQGRGGGEEGKNIPDESKAEGKRRKSVWENFHGRFMIFPHVHLFVCFRYWPRFCYCRQPTGKSEGGRNLKPKDFLEEFFADPQINKQRAWQLPINPQPAE